MPIAKRLSTDWAFASARTTFNIFRRSRLVVLAAALALSSLNEGEGATNTSAEVELWRLDCGWFIDLPINFMSDVFAYSDQKKTLTNSCYLIRHNDVYMLWDAGFRPSDLTPNTDGVRPETLLQQLARIRLLPERISIIGISHFHFDHTGQASLFPGARLLIGEPDLDLLAQGARYGNRHDVSPWLTNAAKVDRVVGDRDVFGDGTVVMLATPGHTMGHYSLLVRLAKLGNVILSGDLWHFAAQIPQDGVPAHTMNRAALLASMDRISKAVTNLDARLVIQHEPADIDKLPIFPLSAK